MLSNEKQIEQFNQRKAEFVELVATKHGFDFKFVKDAIDLLVRPGGMLYVGGRKFIIPENKEPEFVLTYIITTNNIGEEELLWTYKFANLTEADLIRTKLEFFK